MILEKLDTDYYGEVYYRLAGIVDYRKMLSENNYEKFLKWNKKFRHMIFFHTHLIKYLEEPKDGIKTFRESYAVFVPVIEDNKFWEPGKNNDYYNHWINQKNKNKKLLPIAEKIETIEKWQKSWPEILTPDYFYKINNIEELFHYFNLDIENK